MTALDNPIPATLYVTSEPQTPGAAVGLFDREDVWQVGGIFTRQPDGGWEDEDHTPHTWHEVEHAAQAGDWDLRIVERRVRS